MSFGKNDDSKNYVKRFLDATKSNMLFADKVIFVEGLAEQILLPCFAAYEKDKDDNNAEDELISQHVSIISVDSRTFKHFLKLYKFSDANENAINKKVVCITDTDPEKKCEDNKWRSCFPFELDTGENFKPVATHITELQNDFEKMCNNIKVFFPTAGKGKTLEYEIAIANPAAELLIADCFPSQNSPHTVDNIKKLYEIYKINSKDFDTLKNQYLSLLSGDKKTKYEKLVNTLDNAISNDNEKSKALLATIFLNVVKNLKGTYAFELEQKLREDLKKRNPIFRVPEYIGKAIKEVLD
jgi:predicted ATP-dependent endonuclease of OLD family